MRTSPDYREIFCKRLRAMRLASGLSQKKLGILAGIDEFAASTRVNRYERGIYEVDIQTAQRLASVLDVPLAWFYAEDDRLAELILLFSRSPSHIQQAILQTLR